MVSSCPRIVRAARLGHHSGLEHRLDWRLSNMRQGSCARADHSSKSCGIRQEMSQHAADRLWRASPSCRQALRAIGSSREVGRMQRVLVARATKQAFQQARINVPPEVSVEKVADTLIISGPLGTTRTDLARLDSLGSAALRLYPQEREIAVASCSKEFFGTFRALLGNKIQGVTQGYIRYLKIQGIGYRAAIKEQTFTFKLGFSHDLTYELPNSLRGFLLEPTLLGIYGIDKNQVTQAAANIRALRPPSVYKGKGIRYADEVVNIKAGKKK